MAPPPAIAGLSAGRAPPMETRTVVLHSDRDNHKSLSNETGAGNHRVRQGANWVASEKDRRGENSWPQFPSQDIEMGE